MFLTRLFKGGLKFNKLANNIGKVIELNEEYQRNGDFNRLKFNAWYAQVGIVQILEEYHFGLNASIMVPIYGRREKMVLSEALVLSLGKISMLSSELSESEQEIIEDILEKRQAFYDVDKLIPYETKSKLK